MKKIFDKPRGQIAFMYAGALAFALVGALSLGADVSVMYVNWQHSQKTVDAAALAGSNYLNGGIAYSDPKTGTAYTTSTGCNGEVSGSTPQAVATQVACTYAVQNGLTAGNVTITPTATTIQVAAQESTFPYFFGKALGLSTYTVASTATASQPGPPNSVTSGLFPAGIQCASPCTGLADLVPGQSISFGVKHVLTLSPSNYQWVGVGKSAPALSDGIQNGVDGTFSIGDPITVSSGAKTGPVDSAISARLASCPSIADPCTGGGNPSNIPAGDPCLVVVPAVDFTKSPTTIEGFAEVYLENTTTRTQLNGCFIQAVAGNTITSSTSSGAPSLGPLAPPVLTN
jgi:hypothetical protein